MDYLRPAPPGNRSPFGPDRIEFDGVTLRFLRPSQHASLKGLGTPAPSSYITRGQTLNFRAYPKARIQRLYPGIDVAFYGHPGQLEYDLDLARRRQTRSHPNRK